MGIFGQFENILKISSGGVALVSAIISMIAGGISLYYFYDNETLDKQVKQLQMQVSKYQADTDRKRVDMERVMKIYEESIEAIKDSDVARQKFASDLVMAFMSDVPDLQRDILAKLRTSPDQAIKTVVANYQYRVEEAAPASGDLQAKAPVTVRSVSGSGAWNYRIDVFWCETSSTEAVATDIASKLVTLTSGQVRARILPASINSSQGYHVRGVQIRYENNELNFANAVQKFVADDLIKAHIISSANAINMLNTPYKTPNYVSLFLCS